ncbi:hypothetical protein FKP32DRAFT_1595826 [Trametes sanguinea]|nr:hypothetical protein FKP32DRAFT_1595826 [Trametes sanguinea]
MSTIDNLCQSLGLCFSCCCIGCNEASGLFCFYKSCSCCSRRKMNDNEFEREVEELYATKLKDPAQGGSPEVLELQQRTSPTGVSDGTTRVGGGVTAQPGRRPSMDVPRRSGEQARDGAGEEGEGQKSPNEARAERKERTREWVHAHSVSEPGVQTGAREPPAAGDADADAPRSVREREHQRSKSHTPRGSVRERGHGQPPSDAQAYLNAVEQSWRRSEDNDRAREVSPAADGRLETDVEGARGVSASPPRLDIPAMLRPGRPMSYGAPPGHTMPPAAGEAEG